MWTQWSLRLKICVMFTSLLGCFLIVFSAVLYFSLSFTLHSELNHELVSQAIGVADASRALLSTTAYREKGLAPALQQIIRANEESSFLDHIHSKNVIRLEKSGRHIPDHIVFAGSAVDNSFVSSRNLPKEIQDYMTQLAGNAKSPKFSDKVINDHHYRFYRSDELSHAGTTLTLITARSVEPVEMMLKKRLGMIIIGIGMMLALALFVSQFIAAQILQPILSVADTARNITQDNLAARVETQGMDPEMKFLADAFNDMIQRLETSFRFIREFALDVTHELKTPLAIIRGETEIALHKDSADDYRSVLQSILVELDRMLRIIQDLFQITQQDLAIEGLNFQTLDLTRLVEELGLSFQAVVQERKIPVALELPKNPILILGDEVQLRRMFLNLADNAAKASADGGEMGFRCRDEGNKVHVTVWDHGEGIQPEHLPRIFQKFYRVIRAGRPAKRPGHGLGLSMVQSIVKNHQGSVTVQSSPGKGSEFTVTLPCFMPTSK